ncbi:MAG TPA: alkaline phosphatase family protein [Minicystis sp.]|nr:alkaline phosphatase family protein [Minicystis sp.]
MKRITEVACLAWFLVAAAACGSSGGESTGGAGGSSGTEGTATGNPAGTGGSSATEGTGASSSTSTSTASSMSTSTNSGGTGGAGGGGAGGGGMGGFTTIFTIVLENHNASDIVGASYAPYVNQLIAQNGLATNYSDSGSHPSLPNYLYLVSGDTQYPGYVDENPTWYPFPVTADHLGKQFEGAGIKWRAYAESMGTPCTLDNTGEYVPRHVPFLYFDDIQNDATLCNQRVVDMTAFAADLADGSYKYMWLTPNLLSDGHDRDPNTDPGNSDDYTVEVEQSDHWLSQIVPQIQASQTYQHGGVIFITWDEGENSSGDQVPMIIVSPKIKAAGYTSSQAYTHASYLATIEDLLGLPRLGDAAMAQNLYEFFQ